MSNFLEISSAHENKATLKSTEETEQRRLATNAEHEASIAFMRAQHDVLQPCFRDELKVIVGAKYLASEEQAPNSYTLRFVPFKSHHKPNAGNTCDLRFEHQSGKWGIKWSYVFAGVAQTQRGCAGAIAPQDLTQDWVRARCADFYKKAFDYASLKEPFFALVHAGKYKENQFAEYLRDATSQIGR